MRLALLGLDDTTAALAHAAQVNGQDDIVFICDLEDRPEFQPELTRAPRQDWEILLTVNASAASPCDAVLVARDYADEERRLEQLRKLVQGGVPMLVAHPVHRSMLAYYELDMIRRESGCVLLAFLPARPHPLALRLAKIVGEGGSCPLGEVDQIAFERTMPERTKESVATQFARDVDLLRFLGGEVTRLGAMGSAGTTRAGEFAAYNNLGVQMTGAENRLLRWLVSPADDFLGGRLTVTGSRGKAILTMPDGELAWRLECKSATEPATVETEVWNPHQAALDELRAALAGEPSESRWPDAARSVELAEAIERSLLKGRTIELHQEEYSDASTFKGMMTSLGCGLLLATLALVVVAAAASNLLKRAGALEAAGLVAKLPYALLALFVLFLALQFLLKLTRAEVRPNRNPPSAVDEPTVKP